MFRRTVLSGPVSAFKSLLNLSLRLINPGRNENDKIISFRGGYVYHLTLNLTGSNWRIRIYYFRSLIIM